MACGSKLAVMGVEGECGDGQGQPPPPVHPGGWETLYPAIAAYMGLPTTRLGAICSTHVLQCHLGAGTGRRFVFICIELECFPATLPVTSPWTLSSTSGSSAVIAFGSQRGPFMK